MQEKIFGLERRYFIFLLFIALCAISGGIVDGVAGNYFKEVYNADAALRGFIELPRELPGILTVFVLAGLSAIGDIRSALVATVLCASGAVLLGIFTPSFAVMLVFIFVNSLGMHMLMPLSDGIGISLIQDEGTVGKRISQYTGVRVAFQLVAALIIFFGFRSGIFSFNTGIKWIYIVAGVAAILATFAAFYLYHHSKAEISSTKRLKLQLKKKYTLYYGLCILSGAQKQVMLVFGPWVLIEILMKKADTLALLSIISSFIGMFFILIIGKGIDKLGIRTMLYLDAFSFIIVYALYGFLTLGFVSGRVATAGIFALCAMALFVMDRMSMQFSIVRIAYLRNIATDKSDITAAISSGIAMDHVVSIIFAYACGIVWVSFGAYYVFFALAFISIINVIIAKSVILNEVSE